MYLLSVILIKASLAAECTPVTQGAAGSCETCDPVTNLCLKCNYPNLYEPDQNGGCSPIPEPECTEIAQGAAGTCSVCNPQTKICQTCNYPETYEPNRYGNCSLKQVTTKCTPSPNGVAGTCSVCDSKSDLCQTCNYPETYEPNEYGNCSLKQVTPQCVSVPNGAAGTCSMCDPASNLCQTCNYPETYEPNEYGNCSLKQNANQCTPEIYGAGGTCKICNSTTNLCIKCNYPDTYEPNDHGNCSLRQQANQCTEIINGAGGTCSVCSWWTNRCSICNYPNAFVPNEYGNCSSRSGCSPHVSNCRKCDPKDPNRCIRCEYLYGLRGGFCSRCPPYLYEGSTKPCNADCSSIQHCHIGPDYDDDDCERENGDVYCMKCNYGYHPSEDYKSCIRNEPGNCSYPIPGCVECRYNGSSKCIKCNETENFYLDDGKCKCRHGFKLIDNKCEHVKEVDCDHSLKHCDTCVGNSSFCYECDDDYGLVNNTCVKCEDDDAFISGKLPCMTNCSEIPNCKYCHNVYGKYVCRKCEHGFEHNEDHTKCIDKTEAACKNVPGCLKCSQSDPNYCLSCDKKNHFEESDIFPGTCVCDDDYDYLNGQCVVPSGPVTPTPNPIPEFPIAGSIFDRFIRPSDDGKGYQFNPDAFNQTTVVLYILVIPVHITWITIPIGPKMFQLNIPQTTGNDSITVNADPTTQVDLSCSDGAKLVIPDNNNNYILRGGGFITVDPPNGRNSVTLSRITLDQFGNTMTLNSNKGHINVKELLVYGQQAIRGQWNNFKTKCETAKVEGGSTFTPENITFNTLKVGFQSVLYIKGNSNVIVTNYQVYYNITVAKIPLQFTAPFPDFRNSNVQVLNIGQGENLQADDTFNVASFSGDGSQQACESLKIGSGSQYNQPTCQTQGTTTVMVAKKAVSPDDGSGGSGGGKKKKGLSAGAIAGIVVGCVVAVGLVVFLCIWFLVVKKKAIPAHPRTGEPAGSREKLEI